MTTKVKVCLVIGVCLLLTACAAPNPLVGTAAVGDISPAGFWWGLWNGVTVLPAFFGKLFGMDIALYYVNNNGMWYDFGYFLGVVLFAGGYDLL